MVFFFHVQDAFFCKVQDILQHNNFTKLVVDGEYITKNLKMYLSPHKVRIFRQPSTRHPSVVAAIVSIFLQQVNCSLLLADVRPSNISKPLSVLLTNVATCIRHKNFLGYI